MSQINLKTVFNTVAVKQY